MTQPKISGKFYPLRNEEWLRACHELKPAERDVLYYLRTIDPFGDKELELGVSAIAEVLGRNKGTISRALKVLDSKGWIDLELICVKVKVNSFRRDSVVSTQQCCADTTGVGPTQLELAPHNWSCADTTEVALTQRSQSQTQTQQRPQSPKINKTHSDLIDSLSESEREKFFEFARKEAEKLPKPPVLADKWIVANASELIGKFRCEHPINCVGFESHPKWEEALEAMRLAKQRFIALGEPGCEDIDKATRRAMAHYATANNLLWGDEG